jgi:NAD(P)-dependent dehydrogenase (short-subunit alcohol dehydrogenase family)
MATAFAVETVKKPVFEAFKTPVFNLEGKVAFVTGASRGIGRAIALALADAGADVAVSCNIGGNLAAEVCDEIREAGHKAQFYAHSIADPMEVEKLHTEIVHDFGRVDILVNNAGITRDKSFKKMTKDLWDEVIATDLTGVYLTTKQFIDGMAETGWGRVINISSVIGEIGNFGQVNYAAAKAGLFGFTKSLAREYARKGVTVNAVAPGFIKTRMTDVVPEAGLEIVRNATPLGRLGNP